MSELRDDIRIALICQSNVNRSMEAHAMLHKNGYKAYSYGAGEYTASVQAMYRIMHASRESMKYVLICFATFAEATVLCIPVDCYDALFYVTGSKVRLPGESATTPNIYEFGTHYSFMVNDLTRKNKDR